MTRTIYMAHTLCMAAVFMIASAVAQANQCSSGGECPSDNMPKSVTSLLQTKLQMDALEDGSKQNAADQRWGPEVFKYIQDLESLERSRPLLLAERDQAVDPSDKVADPPAGTVGETLFIVTSDSMHYTENLRWISDSWGKDLTSKQLLAIGDSTNVNLTRIHVEETACPSHTIYGACCKAAQVIITARHALEKQPNLKWVFITEDDAYVRAEAVDKRLKTMDPVGETSKGTLIALSGCIGPRCLNGVCGDGGIALSREALMTMVGDKPSKYLKEHMQTCDDCGLMRGDETIGTQAAAHNVTILKQTNNVVPRHHTPTTLGMYGRMMGKADFASTLTSDIEPLLYHPVKLKGEFMYLDQLFAKDGRVDSLDSQYCATYNGNKVCTSNLQSVPWAHYW